MEVRRGHRHKGMVTKGDTDMGMGQQMSSNSDTQIASDFKSHPLAI